VMEPDPLGAVRAAATKAAVGADERDTAAEAAVGATLDPARVDIIGNYTAFHDLLGLSVVAP